MGSMSAGGGTMVRRTLRYAGLTVAAGLVGGVVLVAGAGTTSAPEPANLGAPLGASNGAVAVAVYVYSKAPTTVVEWPTIYTSNPVLVPGTPCANYALPAGSVTTRTIQAATPTSALRKCV